MYLNTVYFGEGAYGVQAAAKIYFNKDVEYLNLAECALIAGILRDPFWRFWKIKDTQSGF